MATNVTYPYGYYYYYPPGPEKYADVERSITRTRSSLMRHPSSDRRRQIPRCMDALSSSSSFVAVVAVVAMTVKIVAVLPVVSVAV